MLNDMTEREAVHAVGRRIGVIFNFDCRRNLYFGRRRKLNIEIGYCRYDDGTLYLYACIWTRGDCAACPCRSIDEAVEWFKEKLK